MAKTLADPAKANRPAKILPARTGASLGRRKTPARLIYPVPIVPDEPDALGYVDMDDMLDEYQACAA